MGIGHYCCIQITKIIDLLSTLGFFSLTVEQKAFCACHSIIYSNVDLKSGIMNEETFFSLPVVGFDYDGSSYRRSGPYFLSVLRRIVHSSVHSYIHEDLIYTYRLAKI